MIKVLIKSVNEIRVETKADCDELRKEVYAAANSNQYKVTGWTETPKNRKEKGEIVEEWYVCKYTLTFNDQKDPETYLSSIEYKMIGQDNVEEALPW